MITQNNINRLKWLVAKYAIRDYKAQSKSMTKSQRRRMSYMLSSDTNEAREMLNMARSKQLSKEEEETIKAYLLKKYQLGQEEFMSDDSSFLVVFNQDGSVYSYSNIDNLNIRKQKELTDIQFESLGMRSEIMGTEEFQKLGDAGGKRLVCCFL